MATSAYSPRNPDPVYDGGDNCHDKGKHRAVVIGHALGAEFIAFNCDLTEAINEFDERFGERCEPTDAALADYLTESEASQKVDAADAKTIAEARMHKAMDEGDVRMNDGGTCVWVDPSEWAKTFDDVRAAMRCFLGIRD